MESKNCRFWLGLGLGSVLGMIAYRYSKTEKARELKKKMCCAMNHAAEQAGEWMAKGKECASGTCKHDDGKDDEK